MMHQDFDMTEEATAGQGGPYGEAPPTPEYDLSAPEYDLSAPEPLDMILELLTALVDKLEQHQAQGPKIPADVPRFVRS